MDGMDMGTTSTSTTNSSTIATMMVPYLHFTGGDNLFFQSWTPSSPGALAGACLGLVLIAILERYLAAIRGSFDFHWRQRALVLASGRDKEPCPSPGKSTPVTESGSITKSTDDIQDVARDSSTDSSVPKSASAATKRPRRLRTITPFIAAQDVPRGLLYGLQMLFTYTLMLAVMTFQAAFLISIILGLGIGEMIFGRVVTVGGGH